MMCLINLNHNIIINPLHLLLLLKTVNMFNILGIDITDELVHIIFKFIK